MSFLQAAAAAFLAVVCVSAQATETVTGRWAAHPTGCEGALFSAGPSPLVVTHYAVRWHGDSCGIGRMYKAGETVYIQALCWSLAGERSIPVSLRPHGDRLALSWDREPRGEFRRCP